MARVKTERIWTIVGDELLTRPGCLMLEDRRGIIADCDTQGPLYVRSGLRRHDAMVFLSFGREWASQDLTAMTVGYLVTAVSSENNGTGILVAGDMMDADPQTWMAPKVDEDWRYLTRQGYSLEEFGLSASQAHILREAA